MATTITTSPIKQLPGVYHGKATNTGGASITVPKPDESVGILSCQVNLVASTLDTDTTATLTSNITAVISADGQSVTIYGWRKAAAGDWDSIPAATSSWTVAYTFVCDMKGA